MDKYLHYGRSIKGLLEYDEVLTYMDMDGLAEFNENLVRASAAYVVYLVGRLSNEEVTDPFCASRVKYLEQLASLLNIPSVAKYLQDHELQALADGHALVVHWRVYRDREQAERRLLTAEQAQAQQTLKAREDV